MPSNTYQSEFTGAQMDSRLSAVAALQEAVSALETAVAGKYAKPSEGIPSTDMDAAVQAALAKAQTAVQSLADYYTKSEVDAIAAAISAAVNSTSGEVVASLPDASASTLGKIYYVGPTSGEYARYVTSYDGTTYSWLSIGTTDVDMTQYATKEELGQLDQKVDEKADQADLSQLEAKVTELASYKQVFSKAESPTASVYIGPTLLTATKQYYLSFQLSSSRTFAITLRSASGSSGPITQTIAASQTWSAGKHIVPFIYGSNTSTYLRVGESADWSYVTNILIYSDTKDSVDFLEKRDAVLESSSLISYAVGSKVRLAKTQLQYGSIQGGGTGAPEGQNTYKQLVYTPFFLIKPDTQITIHYPTSYTVDGVTYPIGVRVQVRDKNNWDAPAVQGTNWSMIFNDYSGATRFESYTVPSNSKYRFLVLCFKLGGAPNNADFLSVYTNNDIYIQYENANDFSQNDIQDANIVHLDTRLSAIESSLGTTSILALNQPLLYDNLMNQLKRRRRVGNTSTESSPRPLLLGHFSDIHGDAENLIRAKEWFTKYASYLDDVLCTGDLIYSSWDVYGFDYWGENNAGNILTCIGNHDTYDGNDWHAHGGLDAYNRYFAPFISGWGVTQPADATVNGYCYYYKDYSEPKVRLIVLDSMEMDETQLSWLDSVLTDVIANHSDYSVVIAEHHPFTASKCSVIDCPFSSYQAQELPEFGDLSESVADKVDDFIDNGGKFICFLQGHTHRDIIYYLTNHRNQLCVVIDCATNKQNSWNDSDRAANTKNQDCLNMVAFDTYSKIVKVVRVGNEWNQQFQRKVTLTVRYSENGSTIPVVLHD